MLHTAMLPAIGLISLQVEEIDEIDLHDVPGPYIHLHTVLLDYLLCAVSMCWCTLQRSLTQCGSACG